VVAVVGDPGVGKSRLLWEFSHSHRTDGWLIVESSSVSYGKATAFLPLIDLLRTYFQIGASDDARKIREKVAGKLFALDRVLEPALPALLELLEVPVDDPEWQRLDPPQRRRQTLDGVKRLVLRESQVQPLLLVFEDLHWIDGETQAFLDSVVESLPTARLLLLVNYRPEYQHSWGSKTYYRQLRIDPLPPESAEELLEALLGNAPGLDALKRLLIQRTEGNPFFLEESVRTLVETNVLAGERGAYRVAKASQTLQIPATAQAILAARIDRLAPEDKRLLQAASVIGKDVPFALLQGLIEGPEEALRRGLAALQAAEFLYEARLFPDLEYTFKHALTHDVAYGSLLQERRRALHARIVDAIETLYSDRLVEHVEQLAEHAFRGEVWDKAVQYLRQASAKALARSTHREAAAYLEQALAALTHLPETRQTLEQAIDIRAELRAALFHLGQPEMGFRYVREAEDLAGRLDDRRRLARVSIQTCHHHLVNSGHTEEARQYGERAAAIAEALNDLPLQIGADIYLGVTCVCLGEFARGEECLGRTVRRLDGDLARERLGLHGFPAALARSYLAWVLAERGDFRTAIARGQEGVDFADAVQHKYSLGFACWGLGVALVAQGDLAQGTRVLERGVGLCRDWNFPTMHPFIAGALGLAHARSGRVEEAVALLREAVAVTEDTSRGFVYLQTVIRLGEALLLADRPEEARSTAERALAMAREARYRVFEPWALYLLAGTCAHREPSDLATAGADYRGALSLAEELGMRPLVAHCHLGLGTLSRRASDRAKAKEHLAIASATYRELAMPVWREKAEAEIRALA
jgi:tetratricopeptide (TPR) repeat protein